MATPRTGSPADLQHAPPAPPVPDDVHEVDPGAGYTEPVKVTVKLSPRTMEALAKGSRRSDLNRTDTINRAIQVYDYILSQRNGPDRGVTIIDRDGQETRLLFF